MSLSLSLGLHRRRGWFGCVICTWHFSPNGQFWPRGSCRFAGKRDPLREDANMGKGIYLFSRPPPSSFCFFTISHCIGRPCPCLLAINLTRGRSVITKILSVSGAPRCRIRFGEAVGPFRQAGDDKEGIAEDEEGMHAGERGSAWRRRCSRAVDWDGWGELRGDDRCLLNLHAKSGASCAF